METAFFVIPRTSLYRGSLNPSRLHCTSTFSCFYSEFTKKCCLWLTCIRTFPFPSIVFQFFVAIYFPRCALSGANTLTKIPRINCDLYLFYFIDCGPNCSYQWSKRFQTNILWCRNVTSLADVITCALTYTTTM